MDRIEGQNGVAYTLTRKLGAGGFGVTHVAERSTDGAQVVVKQLRIDRLDDWKAVELFEREARVLAALDHPHIPAYVDYVPLGDPNTPSGFALVQEFVDGFSLAECVAGDRRLELDAMYRWFVAILDTLVYLHGLSPPVIHRDITPGNVVISSDGEPHLIDFGTVQAAVLSASTMASTSAGTFGYAPMEQFVGRATPASDLYALGVTFVSTLMGATPEKMPFENAHLDVSAALKGHAVDARLRLALEQMVVPDPSRRAQRADEILETIAHLRDGAPPVVVLPGRGLPAGANDPASAVATGAGAVLETDADPWSRALALRQRLGPDAFWNPPPDLPFERPDCAAISPDGRWAVFVDEPGVFFVDLRTMVSRRSGPGGWTSPECAWAPGGQGLLIIDDFREQYVVIPMSADGPGRPRRIESLAKDDVEHLAISPDLDLIAVIDDWDNELVVLMDAHTGAAIRELRPVETMQRAFESDGSFDAQRLLFSPDGRFLFVMGYESTVAYDTQGGAVRFKASQVAVSTDGATLVHTRDEGPLCVVRGFGDYAITSGGFPSGDRLAGKLRDPEALAISPDGRVVAVQTRTDGGDRITIYDATSGRALWTPRPDYPVGAEFSDVESLGFAEDGRLFIDADAWLNPWAEDDEDDYFHIACLATRTMVGTLTLTGDADEGPRPRVYVDGQLQSDLPKDLAPHLRESARPRVRTGTTVLGISSHGFFARLDDHSFLDRSKQAVSHYERQDATRALLLGVPLAEVVTADEVALASDVAARWRFFGEAVRDGGLARNASMRELVTASRGLTAWLPHVLEAAKSVDAGVAGFGAAPSGTPTLVERQVLDALAQLGARDDAQKLALFEDQARALAPPPPARTASKRAGRPTAPRTSAAESALVFAGDEPEQHLQQAGPSRARALRVGLLAGAIAIPTWGVLVGVLSMSMATAAVAAVIAGGFAATLVRRR